MNVQEYISTGILEAYVLDQLPPEERQDVERWAKEYPEVRQEISAIEDSLLSLAQKGAVNPPQQVKEKLFERLDTELSTEENHEKPRLARTLDFYRYLSIAASIVALVGIGLSFYYHREWKTSQSKLHDLLAQNEQLAKEYQMTKDRIGGYDAKLKFLTQPGTETVAMNGLDIAPKSLAYIYWNKNSHVVFLDVAQLPQAPTDKQYQLWAIIDGKPVDAGVFDVPLQADNYIKMKDVSNASAFAVTLEPRGGSKVPTMDQMYVMGKVSPAT